MRCHHTSAACRAAVTAEPGPHTRGLVPRGLLRALGVGLAGVAVMLGAVALRSIPLAGQLWARPDPAQASQVPMFAAVEKPPAELPFRCC